MLHVRKIISASPKCADERSSSQLTRAHFRSIIPHTFSSSQPPWWKLSGQNQTKTPASPSPSSPAGNSSQHDVSVLSLLPFSPLPSVNSRADQWFFPSSKSLPSAALAGLPAAFFHANISPFSRVTSPSFIKVQTSCILLSSRFPLLLASETSSLNILQQFFP